jgi:hypothetical protein
VLGPHTLGTTGSYFIELQHPVRGLSLDDRYDGTEVFAASIWPGGDLAALVAPTAAWATGGVDDVPAGNPVGVDRPVVKLTVAADQTAWLEPVVYSYRVWIPETSQEIRVGSIAFRAGPGYALAPKVYCTYAELEAVAPEVAELAGRGDSGGFLAARGEARRRFEHLLQRHYRHPEAIRDDSLDHLLGHWTRSGAHDATLQGWLDGDRLVLTTPEGKAIRRWCALMAAWAILRREVGDKADGYLRRARLCKREADALVATITAEIDTTTTPDGVGDLFIPLATHDTLRG